MIKIACYKTTSDHLPKTFCQLTEKCYYTDAKICVITENEDLTKNFDRILWTYSKKHFIPHATDLDPYPERQAVYITNSIKNLPKIDIAIFINTSETVLLNFLADNKTNLNALQKILFLFDDTQRIQAAAINNIIEKSYIKHFEVDAFIQTKLGKWEEDKYNLQHSS